MWSEELIERQSKLGDDVYCLTFNKSRIKGQLIEIKDNGIVVSVIDDQKDVLYINVLYEDIELFGNVEKQKQIKIDGDSSNENSQEN